MQDPEGHIHRYLELERRLHELRRKTGDVDCPEEDVLLDEMDLAWHVMSPEEVQRLVSGRGQ